MGESLFTSLSPFNQKGRTATAKRTGRFFRGERLDKSIKARYNMKDAKGFYHEPKGQSTGGQFTGERDVSKNKNDELNAAQKKSKEQLQEEQRREIKNPEPTVIDAATGVEKLEDKPTKEFTSALTNAKAAVEKEYPDRAWRVDSPSAEEFDEYHPGAKKYITQGGSTFAVTSDGDIVGVCKKPGDSKKGSDLLKIAVANGGKKLDSYEGNHDFYTRNGFQPISWCKWDDEFTPPGWEAGRDSKEDVIFYKYVGKPISEILEDFKARVPASEDYGAARKLRDEVIKNNGKKA